MTQFKAGDEVYDASGTRCRFVGYFEEDTLVIPFLQKDDEDDKEFGDPFFAREVFAEPPVFQKHKEITALDAEIDAKKKEAAKLHWEIENAKNERTRLLTTLQENEALQRIEDYLQGKFDFFVILKDYKPLIVSAKEALTETENAWGHRMREGTKLLTLFGTDNNKFRKGRGFSWRINQYSDGSGYDTEVVPVASEDEGREMIQRLYNLAVEDWRKQEGKQYHRALSWADSECVVAPEDVKEFLKKNRVQGAKDALEEARQKLQKATLDLEKAEQA